MDKASEEALKKYFEEKLKQQYQRGLAIGVKTVAKVVLDKLNDSSLPFMDRVTEIRKFCNSPYVTNIKSDGEKDDTSETTTEPTDGTGGDTNADSDTGT